MYEIKCECQIACQKIFRQSVTWWGSLEESNLFPRLSACFQHAFSMLSAKMTPCGALRASSPSSTTVTTSSIWSWILLFHFCLRLGCGDAFCTDTFLQTDDFTHRSLTQSSFYAQIFLHSTKRNVHRRPYTQRFLCKAGSIYTQMLCTKMFLRAEIKAHRRFYTQNLFHREAFAQNNFYTCFFYTRNIWHRETCTHRLHTEVLWSFYRPTFCTQKLYSEQFLHSRNFFAQKPLRTKKYAQQVFADRRFLHRKFSAQKSYAQKVLRTVFLHWHTDIFTHRCLYTETNCTQKLVHTARVYTQPAFTQRGFASPSWSPTFRVPPLKLKQCSNLSAAGLQQTVVHLNQQFPTLGNPLHRDPVAWDVTRSSRTVWTKAEQEMQELRERESELESSERHFFQQEEDLMQQATYLCRFCSGSECLVPRCSCVLQKRINYGLQLSHNQNPSHSVIIVIVST